MVQDIILGSIVKKLENIHPGEIFKKYFLEPMGISNYAFAKAVGINRTMISQLIKGEQSISADTALRLGTFFKMSSEVWLNIQSRFDLLKDQEK